MILSNLVIEKLIQIEASVHYSEPPPPGRKPFIAFESQSPVIVSAPHGAITYRNNQHEVWHEEDEYTASMVILLAELCKTSVIATIWRTEDSDPNEHSVERSAYKKELQVLLGTGNIHWLIDLHGAGQSSKYMAKTQWVDLGLGSRENYLPTDAAKVLRTQIERYLGQGVTERQGSPGFPASGSNRIAAFARTFPGVYSVQIEMKPAVRIPFRRSDASMFSKPVEEGGGSYSASQSHILGMMQALVDFIEYVKGV